MKILKFIFLHALYCCALCANNLLSQDIVSLQVGNKYVYSHTYTYQERSGITGITSVTSATRIFSEDILKDTIVNGLRYFKCINTFNNQAKWVRTDSINVYLFSPKDNKEQISYGLTMGGILSLTGYTATSVTQVFGGYSTTGSIYYSGFECSDGLCATQYFYEMSVTKQQNGLSAELRFFKSFSISCGPTSRHLKFHSPFGVTSIEDAYPECTIYSAPRASVPSQILLTRSSKEKIQMIGGTIGGKQFMLRSDGQMVFDTTKANLTGMVSHSLLSANQISPLALESIITGFSLDSAQTKADLEFEQKSEGIVSIRIYQGSSKEIQRIIDQQTFKQGKHKLTADISKLPKGAYNIQVSGKTGTDLRSFEIR